MSRFCPLHSSSKGNSMVLSGGGTTLLVDAGISCRQLARALADRELGLDQIQGILLTHEHEDHIRGLHTLLKKYDIPVYSAWETLDVLSAQGRVPPGARLIECNGPFSLGDMEIEPFPTPHDAVHSLGFRITMPDLRRVGVATDLGHVTDTVHSHLSGCDLIMLESNYDRGMLECSRYPYPVKRRIKGERGHLSNEDCSREVRRLIREGSSYFVLGHLSENNNLPQLAYQASQAVLAEAGMRKDLDYVLQVAPAREPLEMLVF